MSQEKVINNNWFLQYNFIHQDRNNFPRIYSKKIPNRSKKGSGRIQLKQSLVAQFWSENVQLEDNCCVIDKFLHKQVDYIMVLY